MSIPITKLYLATRNKGKIVELQKIIGEHWHVLLATDLDPQISWEEIGNTFAENALIKALAVRALTTECILAEDSGLVVPALAGAPGVYSARWAGMDGDDTANNGKLLAEMQPLTGDQRAAYYFACLAFIDRAGTVTYFEGRCDGHIATEKRGNNGFGYDPLFIPAGSTATFAELSAETKNRISHRNQALTLFMKAKSPQE